MSSSTSINQRNCLSGFDVDIDTWRTQNTLDRLKSVRLCALRVYFERRFFCTFECMNCQGKRWIDYEDNFEIYSRSHFDFLRFRLCVWPIFGHGMRTVSRTDRVISGHFGHHFDGIPPFVHFFVEKHNANFASLRNKNVWRSKQRSYSLFTTNMAYSYTHLHFYECSLVPPINWVGVAM